MRASRIFFMWVRASARTCRLKPAPTCVLGKADSHREVSRRAVQPHFQSVSLTCISSMNSIRNIHSSANWDSTGVVQYFGPAILLFADFLFRCVAAAIDIEGCVDPLGIFLMASRFHSGKESDFPNLWSIASLSFAGYGL